MAPQDAAGIFTKLTIGDGLVTQVAGLPDLAGRRPAGHPQQLLKRTCLSRFLRRFFSRPQALLVGRRVLGILVFTSLPPIPRCALGLGFASAWP